MKKNNLIIIGGISLIFFVSIGIILYNMYFKEAKYIGKIVSDDEYKNEIFTQELSGSLYKNTADYNYILSSIRTLCSIGSTEKLLGSYSFKNIKKNIFSKIEQKNMDEFIYVELPGLIFNNCGDNIDDTFKKQLLTYLKNTDEGNIIFDKDNISKINTLTKNLEFTKPDSINKNKLKNGSEYFNNIFFVDNLENIKSVYFFDYMINKNDSKKFFYSYSTLSLSESNLNLEKTLGKFENFINDMGFKSIEEFRIYLLKHNNFQNVDELKNDMIKNYDELEKNIEKDLGFNLTSKLLNIETLYEFYISDDFKKLKENKEILTLFNKLGKEYIYFAITNTDYADGLDEGWSGKEFFGESVKGNRIIRIGYMYLLGVK